MKTDQLPSLFQIWSIFYPAVPLIFMFLIAWRRPHLGRSWFRVVEKRLGRVARHRWQSCALVGGLTLGISVAISLLVRWPQPVIADEFSYLLAADTFAAGRLANPPHPFWPHFESLHVLQQPVYASKYQPAQGLILAFSQQVTSTPVVGVWLVVTLGVLAVSWMLRAWLSNRLALLGGLLAAIHPIVLEWGQNFWGGGLPLLGGALTLGATGRIWRRPGRWDGLFLGLGLAILATCRPFEGAVLGLLCGGFILGGWLRRQVALNLRGVLRLVFLAGLVLAPTGLLIATYNRHVTGNSLRMPYLVHQETYAIATPFLWQQLQPMPGYRHESIRRFYLEYELATWRELQTLSGLIRKGLVRKIGILLRGYLATATMAIALLLFPLIWRWRPDRRPLWILLGLFIGGVLTETWLLPHYIAPAAGLLFLMAIEGWRILRTWSVRGQRVGLWLARASLMISLLGVVNLALRIDRDEKVSWAWVNERTNLASRLSATGTRHLLLVRYGPAHNPHQEWVYNPANIDAAPVVWAREMDQESNRRLIDYFKERTCHLVVIEDGPPSLRPCP
ncbi:MAG: hypothetical protein ACK5RR_16180 [Acidobacteriota bacterium]